MKRVAVAVAVVWLLSLTQVGQTASLEAGWYVKLAGVALFGFDPNLGHDTGTDWHFTGGLGTQGPFSATSPDPVWAERMVSVPDTVTGVSPGTSVWLWGTPTHPVTYPVTSVVFFWETDYDASQMRVELLSYDGTEFAPLWSQASSGLSSSFDNVLGEYEAIPVGSVPVFRVTVVPEPPTLVAVSVHSVLALFAQRRRAR